MKKIIFITLTIAIFGAISILNFSSFLNSENVEQKNRLTFVNYNSSDDGINSDNGSGVAFDSENNVAYTGLAGGGLSFGVLGSNKKYTFANYNSLVSNTSGTGVAFDNNDDIGYSSLGGLSIGRKSGTVYTFTNYNLSNTNGGITNNNGSAVAFDNRGNVGFASIGGGLTIGILDSDATSYTFTNYSFANDTSGITNDQGFGVAFANNGVVAYVSNGGGLSIGTPPVTVGEPYTFVNYNRTNTNRISTNSAFGVSFDSKNDVAYAGGGNSGSLSIGTPDATDEYSFVNYDVNDSGINSTFSRAVAFDNNNDIGYVTDADEENGGLSAGYINASGNYQFINYNSSTTVNFGNNSGRAVAFDNNDDAAYASAGGGLSIGRITNPTVNINSQDFIYNPRSSDNNLTISKLPITFGYSLQQLLRGEYVEFTISDSSNTSLVAIYLTHDGSTPDNTPSVPETASYAFHSDDNDTYDVAGNGLTNNGSGFVENATYNISVNLVKQDQNVSQLETTTFTVPNDGSLPNVNFDINDLEFVELSNNRYFINNFIVFFSYPLRTLTPNEYVLINISDDNGNLVTIYLTDDGQTPSSVPTQPAETRTAIIHQDNNAQYVFNSITNNKNGFAPGSSFKVDFFVGFNATDLKKINQIQFNTPASTIEPSNAINNTFDGKLIGGIVGGLGGVVVLGGTSLFVYMLRRKRNSK